MEKAREWFSLALPSCDGTAARSHISSHKMKTESNMLTGCRSHICISNGCDAHDFARVADGARLAAAL
jgi:hypothetical protein